MLRDYEIPLLEEMLQEEKYQNNIPLATSFVKDFLEEYKKLKKLLAKYEENSAEEMFEELGYVKTNLLKTPSVHYENKKWETAISIFDNEKGRSIHIYALGNTYQDSGFIGIDELKAINQQCKELGWL